MQPAPLIKGSKIVEDANADGIAQPGEQLTYTIKASNSGTKDAHQVLIKDELTNLLPHIKETDLDKVSLSVLGGSNPSADLTMLSSLVHGFKIDIKVDEEVVVKFTITMKDKIDYKAIKDTNDAGVKVIVNTALVGPDTPTANIKVVEANLSITKTVNKSKAQVGDKLVYTIVVKNNSDVVATERAVKDVINDSTKVKYVTGSINVNGVKQTDEKDEDMGSYESGTIMVYFPELAANSTNTITFEVSVLPAAEGQTILNMAWLLNPNNSDDNLKTLYVKTVVPKAATIDETIPRTGADMMPIFIALGLSALATTTLMIRKSKFK